jgi:hypothetical protein
MARLAFFHTLVQQLSFLVPASCTDRLTKLRSEADLPAPHKGDSGENEDMLDAEHHSSAHPCPRASCLFPGYGAHGRGRPLPPARGERSSSQRFGSAKVPILISTRTPLRCHASKEDSLSASARLKGEAEDTPCAGSRKQRMPSQMLICRFCWHGSCLSTTPSSGSTLSGARVAGAAAALATDQPPYAPV